MAEVRITFNGKEGRRCIGSAKFGIKAHDAPVEDFPVQPSQKDGLGRMCRPHWTDYTRALRKAAVARKAGGAATIKSVDAKFAEALASEAKGPAIRPVPKPAKKPARRRMTPAMARKAADAGSVSDGTVPRTIRESIDGSFGREREAEHARTVEASDAARAKAADEEATIA